MPLFIVPLLMAAALFLSTSLVFQSSLQPTLSLVTQSSIQMHYTKGGIVQIVPSSGATRFIPYRLAGDLERRRDLREAL